MSRRKALIIRLLLTVVTCALATYYFLPKKYAVGERLSRIVVFWNQREAFFFLDVNTFGRSRNIVQEKLAGGGYGYWALFVGGQPDFYTSGVTAYRLQPLGQVDRFVLAEHTASYGHWTLKDGKLELTPPHNRDRRENGFRWDGEKFVLVSPQANRQSEADFRSTSKSSDSAAQEDEEFVEGLSDSERSTFENAGWHVKMLSAFEIYRGSDVSLSFGKETYTVTVHSFASPKRGTREFDLLSTGAKRTELSGLGLKPANVLWEQKGWREISKAQYQQLAEQYGLKTRRRVVDWILLSVVALLLLLKFGSYLHWLWALAMVKRTTIKAMPTVYSFPPAIPAQFPLLESATLDRYTQAFEALGFTKIGDLSPIGDVKEQRSIFCRLMVNARHHCFAEISQIFPRWKPAQPLKCYIEGWLQDGWSLSFTDRKPAATTSLTRRRKALTVSMPQATTTELMQAFLKMRDQVCLDLAISPLREDTLQAYINEMQRCAAEMREEVGRKNIALGLSQVVGRKFRSLSPQAEYVWLGDYPKETERRKQGTPV